MSEDESMVQSILEEINSDKEQMNQQQQMQQQQQMNQQQHMQQQQQMMEKQKQQEHMNMVKQQQMLEQRQHQIQVMEKQRMMEGNQKNNDKENICENVSLLDEFKSSIIFFVIFILINITQFNTLICSALSIDNNNIKYLINGLQNQNKLELSEVTSPTFNLLNEYQINEVKINHYDLFRLKSPIELENLDLFSDIQNAITVIAIYL